MTTQISETAVARREASRDRASGRFGNDPAAESDLTLDDLGLTLDKAEEEPEGFDHARISSLMGDAYHLDPERTVSLPRINEDDTIAQIHHKLNRYLAKTQDLSEMDDAELAELAGFDHDPDTEMPDELRNSFGIPEGDRVVVGRTDKGKRVYISAGNTAKKTGEFYSRYGGPDSRFKVVNVAEVTIAPAMKDEFTEDHPGIDPKNVNQLFRRLNGSYRGKGHRSLDRGDPVPDQPVPALHRTRTCRAQRHTHGRSRDAPVGRLPASRAGRSSRDDRTAR